MVEQTIDGIVFHVNKAHDFSFLKKYGKVFSVIDSTGSGCICFGVEKNNKRVFIKIAGAETVEAEVSKEESIRLLQHASMLYKELSHPNLIHLIEAYAIDDLYVAVFDYAEGECLFDHWNFDYYKAHPEVRTPWQRFYALPIEKKLYAAEVLFSFLIHCAKHNYVAVDFYDSSILYDFDKDVVTLCDIDLFQKAPLLNEVGEDYWGTRRFKAPEEYLKGAMIDERTNVFTLAAMVFSFFTPIEKKEIDKRYKTKEVLPPDGNKFTLHDEAYAVLEKALSKEKEQRYASLKEFHNAWKEAQR